MKVKKRNGDLAEYDVTKIWTAISSAFNEFDEKFVDQVVMDAIEGKMYDGISVEEIQDIVEDALFTYHYIAEGKAYARYRYEHELARQCFFDNEIMTLIDGTNEYWSKENSNKNPDVASTQRDYIAGITSKYISRKFIIPKDVAEAHEQGIIHYHDQDYAIQKTHNCDLVNLDDMLQNGTVISGTMIEKPHSFATACNIATQIIAQVASCQYGGQTISLTHLAPFVDISRQKIKKETLKEYIQFTGHEPQSEQENKRYLDTVESKVREEIKRGVQTIQYQVVTLMTTNGQAPFLSVAMYLNEAKDEQTKQDLALIIEEVLLQRIQGTKNEQGVWVTPAFPKLLYFLEDDNTYEGSKYFYLTELAAKCTAKRMVPDYISEKKMLEYKIDGNGDGNAYPCINKICA